MIAVGIEKIYNQDLTNRDVIVGVVLLVLSMILRFVSTKMATHMSFYAARTVKGRMRGKIYSKVLQLDASYKEKVTTAELVQESVEGDEQLESYFGQYVPQFYYAFIAPITLFILFWIAGSLKVAIVLLICVPLIPGAIMMVQKIAKRLLSKYWDRYAELGSAFLENLQGMTTLKIYKADAYKNVEMNEESEEFRRITMKVLTMQLNSIIIMDFFTYGGAALGIALAGISFAEGQFGIASALFMILLSAEFFLPMRRLGSYFHVAMNGMAASDRIFKFLNLDEPNEKTQVLIDSNIDINIKNAHITYVGIGSVFFKGTVRDNLLIAKAEATDDELWEVLKRCNLDLFFLRMSKGLTLSFMKMPITYPEDKGNDLRLQERCFTTVRFIYLMRQHPISIWKVKI